MVTFPEDLPLTKYERSVLTKGLNFIPTAHHSDECTARSDCENFFRRLQLRGHYSSIKDPVDTTIAENTNHSGDFDFGSLKRKTTRWTPPSWQFSALDYYITKCRREISKFTSKFKERLRKTNITSQEWTALMTLKRPNDVVIKSADKGGAVVAWARHLYVGWKATLRY